MPQYAVLDTNSLKYVHCDKVTMLDANTGKPRTIIDIERATKLTMSEESGDGLRRRKYRAIIPPEANKAA